MPLVDHKYRNGYAVEWGDRLFYPRIKRPKTEPEKHSAPYPTGSKSKAIKKLERTVSKTPEVVVKISGGGSCMKQIKAHLDYISRNGKVELEDQDGNLLQGKESIKDIKDDWAVNIGSDKGQRRESFNIILSMPPGTDREKVTDAAREFAKEKFGENHQYVFATHKDEEHPHVHLIVKATGRDGTRLNPRKADLQDWRERFAKQLRFRGVEANATPRWVRGQVRKPRKQNLLHMEKEGRIPRVRKTQFADIVREAGGGKPTLNPAKQKIIERHNEAKQAYQEAAADLAKSGDPKLLALAEKTRKFGEQLPAPKTEREIFVEKGRAAQEAQRSKEKGQER